MKLKRAKWDKRKHSLCKHSINNIIIKLYRTKKKKKKEIEAIIKHVHNI